MPVSDSDIARSAHLWIQQHGESATAKACEMVESMRRKGDAEGADTWLRIIVAIDDLGTKRLVLAVLFTAALAACKTQKFEHHTGAAWRPRSGSMVNHRTLTSAMIDSRDFLAAKRRAETEVLVPVGPKVAFTGGLDFNDHRLIWDALDKVHVKHRDMVLLHGGSPKGAERIERKLCE